MGLLSGRTGELPTFSRPRSRCPRLAARPEPLRGRITRRTGTEGVASPRSCPPIPAREAHPGANPPGRGPREPGSELVASPRLPAGRSRSSAPPARVRSCARAARRARRDIRGAPRRRSATPDRRPSSARGPARARPPRRREAGTAGPGLAPPARGAEELAARRPGTSADARAYRARSWARAFRRARPGWTRRSARRERPPRGRSRTRRAPRYAPRRGCGPGAGAGRARSC